MNNHTIQELTAELESEIIGKRLGRIFQLSPLRFVIDLRLSAQKFLLISVEPGSSRAHLIRRRIRDLEKQSAPLGPFALGLRKRLTGAEVEAVEKLEGERVLRFYLKQMSELGEVDRFSLVAQLTGSSSNLFLLDSNGMIVDRVRSTTGEGQETADAYSPPTRKPGSAGERPDPFQVQASESLSDAIDRHYAEKDARDALQSRVRAARGTLLGEITKREKLLMKLEGDLETHGDAEKWKRFGDLLLANLAEAKRDGTSVAVTDYFDEATPTVQVEVDENDSLTEAAEKYFKRYTKARNAKERINERMAALVEDIAGCRDRLTRFEVIVAEGDEAGLARFEDGKSEPKRSKKAVHAGVRGARKFRSSDGLEIYVGKGSKDNDSLTFRTAKSWDTWLHAADYPGSHVIVRNPSRGEIPQRTLLEAAQLAAFYSDARYQLKAAVNYTQKKFVNKPKGAPPGLVSLASFKTVLVQPAVPPAVSQE